MGTNFTVSEISQILELMAKNEVTEFRLELGEGKLWLKRGADTPAIISMPAAGQAVSPAPLPSLPPVTTPTPIPSPLSSPAQEKSPYHELKSPMVGTFYRRPSPDANPYAQVGDVVRKGQVLCIVEAMKLMNEIQSDVAGKVVEVCLEDGQMAEYGEVLFRIDTGV